ncbi:MAG: peptidoglycan editing factor PgeF [Pseudomonadota bacterium]
MIGVDDFRDWPAPPRVRAVQTLRGGGVSAPPFDTLNLAAHVGDAAEAVATNRQRLRRALQLPSEPVWLQQVHGTEVVELRSADAGTPCADGAWTSVPGVVCAVLSADCLPVLLAASDGSIVAAVHAGWRGLAAGVLEAAVAALPVPPARLRACFGAAIGPQAYEVGADVHAAFVSDDATAGACFVAVRRGHWLADLYGLARLRLQRAGVVSIHGGGRCSYRSAERYFSHRRDGVCGRMASLIWISC